MPKLFTPDEINMLKANPYTLRVSETTIKFTLAFKEAFMEGYKKGIGPVHLFRELGYDPDVIGKSRIDGHSKSIRKEDQSELGLHQGIIRYSNRILQDSYSNKLSVPQTIKRMQREIIYLRQELEFVKKIINHSSGKGQSK